MRLPSELNDCMSSLHLQMDQLSSIVITQHHFKLTEKGAMCTLPYFANLMYFVCLQDPVDPQEACGGPRGRITQYQIRFQIGSFRETEYVNSSACRAERCSHTFNLLNILSDSVPSSYDSVSVAAENVVGVGPARTCTAQSISKFNSCLLVQR